MKVLKFGGTSVGTPDTIKGLLQILKGYYQQGDKFTVVFSAFSKVTDALIEMATKAGKGDERYQDIFEKVRTRHFEAIVQLLESAQRPPVEAHIAANFEALGNVLQGIFLLREVSPRSLDLDRKSVV